MALASYLGRKGGHRVIFYGNPDTLGQKRTLRIGFLILIQATQSPPILLQRNISKKGNCLSAISLKSSLVKNKKESHHGSYTNPKELLKSLFSLFIVTKAIHRQRRSYRETSRDGGITHHAECRPRCPASRICSLPLPPATGRAPGQRSGTAG